MSLLSRGANLYFTYKFIRRLTQKWEDTEAFEKGIIDKNGKALKRVSELTSDEKDVYTLFDRLVYNLKRIMEKLPFGKTRLASYAAALYLIKEHTGMPEEEIEQVMSAMEIDIDEDLNESFDDWKVVDGQLGQGTYRLVNDIQSPISGEFVGNINNKIIVKENAEPVGTILGRDVFEVQHAISKQMLYVTSQDLKR